MRAARPVSSTHYEVVDDRDEVVGNMRHANVAQAVALQQALQTAIGLTAHVALVVETVTVQRCVQRLQSAAGPSDLLDRAA